jgi:hypothetical protein
MNASNRPGESPPKETPALAANRGLLKKIQQLERLYHLLCWIQTPFRVVFWEIEKSKSRLRDRITAAAFQEGS